MQETTRGHCGQLRMEGHGVIVKLARIVFLFASVAGCSGQATERPIAAVRDSAGIEIVENFGEPSTVWEIVHPHRVEIGVTVGEAAYQLSGVRAGVRTSDGRIVIADAGSSEVRFFDSEGRFLNSAGKQGGGPGEFEALANIWRIERDSVLAFDSRSARITVLGPDGDYVRDVSLSSVPGIGPRSTIVGVTRDGTLLARWTEFGTPDTDGYLRERGWFAFVSGMDAAVVLGHEFSGNEYFQGSVESSDGMAMIMIAGLPYASELPPVT